MKEDGRKKPTGFAFRRGKRKRGNHPGYSREYVEESVDEYLRGGGKITRVKIPKNGEKKGDSSDVFGAVDNFLNDNGISLKFA